MNEELLYELIAEADLRIKTAIRLLLETEKPVYTDRSILDRDIFDFLKEHQAVFTRLKNVMAGFYTAKGIDSISVGEFVKTYRKKDLLSVRDSGKATINELKTFLKAFGITWT